MTCFVFVVVTHWRKEGRTDRRTDGRKEGRTDGRTDGRKEGRTDGRKELGGVTRWSNLVE